MKKLFIVMLVVLAGLIGLHISISAHKAEVTASKEATFCSNTRIYSEWKVDEKARVRARKLAYIYKGEENAPEIAAAKAALAAAAEVKEAYNRGDVAWKEVLAARDHAVWEAGKNLVAWMERTGRCPINRGEGPIFCYLTSEAETRTKRDEASLEVLIWRLLQLRVCLISKALDTDALFIRD